MSSGVDLSEFFDTFFDEADELLADMERLLIGLDLTDPDGDDLNAIFRVAHSIKGGAGTFGCFDELASTTHLLENLLDQIRHGELALRKDMVDLFLETKDVLTEQVAAYRGSEKPDQQAYERICAQLLELAETHGAATGEQAPDQQTGAVSASEQTGTTGVPPTDTSETDAAAAAADESPETPVSGKPLCIRVRDIQPRDIEPLSNEMALMGNVLYQQTEGSNLAIWLDTSTSAADLEAVCCFIVNAEQISIAPEAVPVPSAETGHAGVEVATSSEDSSSIGALDVPTASADSSTVAAQASAGISATATAAFAKTDAAVSIAGPGSSTETAGSADDPASQNSAGTQAGKKPIEASGAPAAGKDATSAGRAAPTRHKESGTIRVGVEKVDQIINLVGELVITQAMLVQRSQSLDPVLHDRLLNGIEQLERNARDLQESVMSIRMMPMDYVFSRFPRVVRENADRMGKKIRLVTKGQATELDKSLIERIIDPLTHLVRNSLDHGLETPDKRLAQGKSAEGTLTLSAQHSGGQIIIDVMDDGAGLDRERILAKAIAAGFPVSEATPDDELWQLIFAPGFSTAEKVTDISGRGVGMDVVRRNIQALGGHVQLSSTKGSGTSTRIVLPLTLAILDGMSVRVGAETFILPLSHVTESLQADPEQVHRVSDGEYMLHVRGEYLPIVVMHEVFDIEEAETDLTRAIAVILQAEDMRFALMVDHLIGQHQVVVKNLETNYRKVPGISAATILGDGSVALIVDVFALRRVSARQPGAAA